MDPTCLVGGGGGGECAEGETAIPVVGTCLPIPDPTGGGLPLPEGCPADPMACADPTILGGVTEIVAAILNAIGLEGLPGLDMLPDIGGLLGGVTAPIVSIANTDSTSAEDGVSSLTFVVTADTAPTADLVVNLIVNASSTAVAGDFVSVPTSVTIPADATSVSFNVVGKDDDTNEVDSETLTIDIGAPAASEYVVAAAPDHSASGTIADDPTLSLSVSATTVTENNAFTITVTRAPAIGGTLIIDCERTGTADDLDFEAGPNSCPLTFTGTNPTATSAPDTKDDVLDESDETATYTLEDTLDYQLDVPASIAKTVTINDADVSTGVVIAATTSVGAEGGADAEFTISRATASNQQAITVTFAVTGTAGATDYVLKDGATALTTSIALAAGVDSKVIAVEIDDDTADEADETVILTLASGATYALGAGVAATATIQDDDQPVVSIAVGGTPAENPDADGTFTISRPAAQNQLAITVNFAVTGSATRATDYVLKDGATTLTGSSITLGAGVSSKQITLDVSADVLDDDAETVIVTLAAGTGYALAIAPDDAASATIQDDPSDLSTGVAISGTGGREGAASPSFTVTRTGIDPLPAITVGYTVTGSATSATDFDALPGTVVIPAGQLSSAPIALVVNDDASDEADETITLTLSAGTGYALGAANAATVTLADNDAVITVTPTNGAESGPSNGRFTISRAVGTSRPALTVAYTVGGTATAGSDYTALGTSAIIPAGATSVDVSVAVLDDVADEVTEDVTLDAAAGTGYGNDPDVATVTISDNDNPTVSIAATTNGREAGPNTPVVFTLSRAAAQNQLELSVPFVLTGTATDGADYTGPASPLTFPAGQTSVQLTIPVIADGIAAEPQLETVIATIGTGSGYSLGTQQASRTIESDTFQSGVSISKLADATEAGVAGAFLLQRDTSADAITVNLGYGASTGTDPDVVGNRPTGIMLGIGEASKVVIVQLIDADGADSGESITATIQPSGTYLVATPSAASMTFTDSEDPVTHLNVLGVASIAESVGWTNPSNAQHADDQRATATASSRSLRVAMTDVPAYQAGARITSVVVKLEASLAVCSNDLLTLRAYNGAGNVLFTSAQDFSCSSNDSTISWDLTNIRAWTETNLNDLEIKATTKATGTLDGTWRIDRIAVEVGLNLAPVVTPGQSIAASEDAPESIEVEAIDPNGDSIASLVQTVAPLRGAITLAAPTGVTYLGTLNTNDINDNGFPIESFSLKACDTSGFCGAGESVAVTVDADPDAPTANNFAVSVGEDPGAPLEVNFGPNVADVEDADGVLEIDVLNVNVGSFVDTPDPMVFEYSPPPNFAGADAVAFTVIDSEDGTSQERTVSITVTSVNDAPVFEDVIGDQVTNEDTPITGLGITIGDGDSFEGSPPTQTLTVTGSSDNPAVIANSGIVITGTGADRTVSITPVANANSAVPVVITLSLNDGGSIVTDDFTVTVDAVDDNTVLASTASVIRNLQTVTLTNNANANLRAANEGETVRLSATGSTDPDGPLTCAWTVQDPDGTGLNDGDLTDAGSCTLTTFVAPTLPSNAPQQLLLRLTLSGAGTAGTLVRDVPVDVVNLNGNPTQLSAFADADNTATIGLDESVEAGIQENALVTLTITAMDPDGDAGFTYTVTQDRTGLHASDPVVTLAGTGNTRTFTAPNRLTNAALSLAFTVRVGDGNGGSVTATELVPILNINGAPTANAGADIGPVNVASTVQLTSAASSDPDADVLARTWTLTGSECDGDALFDDDLVVDCGAAGAPVLSDASAAAPTFTAPSPTVATQLRYQVEINDGIAASVFDTVVVSVKRVNTVPVQDALVVNDADAGTTNPNVREGSTVSVTANAVDPDVGETIAYTFTQDRTGPRSSDPIVVFSGVGAARTFTAPSLATGSNPATKVVKVDVLSQDSQGATDTESITLTIVNGDVAPVANAGSDRSVAEGVQVTLSSTGSSDADGEALTYAWTQVSPVSPTPTLSGANTATATFTSPTLTTNAPLVLTFQLTVTDAADPTAKQGTDTVVVTVTNVNGNPAITNPGSQFAFEETLKLISVSAVDPDGDSVAYSISSNPTHGSASVNPTTGQVSYTGATDYVGADSLTVRAQDNFGGSSTLSITITVQSVNDRPDFVKGADQAVGGVSQPAKGVLVTVPGWATGISDGDAEATQTVSFVVSTNNPGAFDVAPAVSDTGELTYQIKSAAGAGSILVAVRGIDNGGTANGGEDTSFAKTFQIVVS